MCVINQVTKKFHKDIFQIVNIRFIYENNYNYIWYRNSKYNRNILHHLNYISFWTFKFWSDRAHVPLVPDAYGVVQAGEVLVVRGGGIVIEALDDATAAGVVLTTALRCWAQWRTTSPPLMITTHDHHSWSQLMITTHDHYSWSPLMIKTHDHHPWLPLMIKTHDHHSLSPLMITTHDHHSWSPLMITTYDHHSLLPLMITTHDHHSWSPLMIATHDRHSWSPLMITTHDHHSWSPLMITTHDHHSLLWLMITI